MQKSPIVRKDDGYFYILNGKRDTKKYLDKTECARAFVKHFIERNPKYKPLVEGKTWAQIMKLFSIS